MGQDPRKRVLPLFVAGSFVEEIGLGMGSEEEFGEACRIVTTKKDIYGG